MPFSFKMIKNYFLLNRFLLENSPNLLGKPIVDLFTQAKDRLFAAIPSEALPDRHLIIDTSPNLPFLLIKKEHKKAKKNTKDFLTGLLPSEIKKIEIAQDDRIIKFSTVNFNIYFTIKSPKTNVYFLKGNNILSSFKNVNDPEIVDFLTSKKYVLPAEDFKRVIENYNNIEDLRKELPYFNKIIVGEYYSRTDLASEALNKTILTEILTEILFAPISIAISEGKLILSPSNWDLLQKAELLKEFENANEAFAYYISNLYKFNELRILRKELNQILDKRLEQFSQKLNKLKFRIDRG